MLFLGHAKMWFEKEEPSLLVTRELHMCLRVRGVDRRLVQRYCWHGVGRWNVRYENRELMSVEYVTNFWPVRRHAGFGDRINCTGVCEALIHDSREKQ